MPRHVADHLAMGHHHWGIFQQTRDASIGELVDVLQLIWSASEAEEWIDKFEYIPY